MTYTAKVGGYNWKQNEVAVRDRLRSVLAYLERIERETDTARELADNRQQQIHLYQALHIVEEQLDMEEK